jgi:hypothetical protein
MKIKRYFFSFVFLITLSCGKDSACFKGTGKITKEERVVSAEFSSIITANGINIEITQGTPTSLILEGGANLLPYINTEFSDGKLSISSDNKCRLFRDYSIPITVYLTVDNLSKIEYSGQGIITSSTMLCFPDFIFETYNGTGSVQLNLKSNNIGIIQHTGATDITLSGSTNSLYAYLFGTGRQNHEALSADVVHVKNTGTGDVAVTANRTLLIELSSSGNISYYGNPLLTIGDESGSGKLIAR